MFLHFLVEISSVLKNHLEDEMCVWVSANFQVLSLLDSGSVNGWHFLKDP